VSDPQGSAHDPIHPGEILLEEFLLPAGISQNGLANAMGVPPRRLNEIVHGARSVTPDTAARLSRALETTDLFWLNLQNRFDLEVVRSTKGEELDRISLVISA